MPRKPKAKDGLTARERVALYEAQRAQKGAEMSREDKTYAIQGNNEQNDALSVVNQPKTVTVEVKPLPKPQHATVRVDFSLDTGEIKPMHGMCNGPVSYGADLSELFRQIGVPSVRFSGTDTAISALAVDISRIFKNPDADPHDENNYDFACTDDYVRAAYNCGARVIFRLGESYDREGRKKVSLPKNIDTFCEVCANVARHYNDYWAHGYAYGIERFEIWGQDPESDNATRAASFELYRKLAGVLKLYDPSIKVGGMCFEGGSDVRDFLRFCRKTHAPLDFITFSLFEGTPTNAAEKLNSVISPLQNLGFNDTEIIIGEWAYIANNVDKSTNIASKHNKSKNEKNAYAARLFTDQAGIKGAAYALSFMLEVSAIPQVWGAYLYDAQPAVSPWCPICDRFGQPQKTFYAFKMFGELYRARRAVYCASEQAPGYAHSGVYASAAMAASGECYVLISSFGGCGVVDLRLDGIPESLYTAEIYILDGVKSFERGDSVQLTGAKKRLLLNISEYGAVLVKLF